MFLSNNNKIRKKEESKQFGVNKDKSMSVLSFLKHCRSSTGKGEQTAWPGCLLLPDGLGGQQDNAAERSE